MLDVDIECVVVDIVPFVCGAVVSVPPMVSITHSPLLNVHPVISLHATSVVVSLHAGDTDCVVLDVDIECVVDVVVSARSALTAATANAIKHKTRIFHKYAHYHTLIHRSEL